MQIQGIVQIDEPEKIWLNIKNVSGATMTQHGGVVLACTGNSADGSSAVKPVNTSYLGWVGIIDEDIADTGFGRAQVFGYRDSILLSHEGTSVTVTIGDALHLVSGVYGLNTSTVEGLSTMASKCVVCLQTNTISAAAYVKGLIRCL